MFALDVVSPLALLHEPKIGQARKFASDNRNYTFTGENLLKSETT
jgi:hypothetical protein